MSEPPQIAFSPTLSSALKSADVDVSELRSWLEARARPAAILRSHRVSPQPLRRNPLLRVLGAKAATPTLGPLASKWGGTPYTEEDEDWRHHAFLGQLDLSAAPEVVPALGLHGLLRIDVGPRSIEAGEIRVKWFPEPSLSRYRPCEVASVGAWECEVRFEPSWTLPETQHDFFDHWPAALRDAWLDVGEDLPGFAGDTHRLGGWATGGLDEPYFFEPPSGAPRALTDYEMLLRICSDSEAGFSWGSNWIYVLLAREDLKRGDASRLVVTAANS